MIPKLRLVRTSRQIMFLASFLWIAASDARAQNQSNGSQFQGSVFSPALENVSLSKGSVLIPTLILEGSYDTNLLQSQSGPRLAGIFQVVEGELKYDIRRPGNDLLLSYWGGERIYPAYSNLNGSMQDVRLQWQHRVTSRLDFALTSRWASLPGGAVLENNPGQGFPLLGSVPLATAFLQQRFNTSQTTMTVTEKLAPHLSAVLGGNFVDTTHSGENLINTKELDAYGGLSYMPARGQSFGLIYAQQWLKFGLGFGSSEVKSLFLSYTLGIAPKVSVSVFAGPSQVQQMAGVISNPGTLLGFAPGVQNIPLSTQRGTLGGAKIEKRDKRNTARLSYTRLVTGGSGYLSTVLQQSTEMNMSRSISPRLDLSLGGTYSQSTQIGASTQGFNTYYIAPALSYRWSRDVKLTVRNSYGKISGLPGSKPIDREEISFRLEYSLPPIL
jgi:hypothetical protein